MGKKCKWSPVFQVVVNQWHRIKALQNFVLFTGYFGVAPFLRSHNKHAPHLSKGICVKDVIF